MKLEQLNWELTIAYLREAEEALHEVVERLGAARGNIKELKQELERQTPGG